ncbi:MAG: GC-type dockerin domain-anchored protein [Phycisphaerales bacterium]|nr:GC-type dockerin domain-anchored protein [Phycisphaerales bacterium]
MRGAGFIGCVAIGTLGASALAQASPVRSSIESFANISLTVVDESDESQVFDEQLDTSDNLGPVVANAMINSAQGTYLASSQTSASFVDADQGEFNGVVQYEGHQGVGEIKAQRYQHTLFSKFEYDFTIPSDGAFHVSGLLSNQGPSPVGFYALVRVYAESTLGGGFTGAFFEQQILDTGLDGEAINLSVPLTNASGSYRVQIQLLHSGLGSLDQSLLSGSLSAMWEIESENACPADLNGDGNLNFLDVSEFLAAFGAMDPVADFNGDTMFNFLDVSAFLSAFGAGCP